MYGAPPEPPPHVYAPPRVDPSSSGAPNVEHWILPVGRSGWAIAAGYAGLFALLLYPAPIALLLGIIAIVHLQKNPEKRGMGRAVFGLVAGVLGSALLLLIYSARR